MIPGYIGSILGGAIMAGSATQAVFNIKANPTLQGIKKELPAAAATLGGAVIIVLSQTAAADSTQQIALLIAAIAASVISSVTVVSSETIDSYRPQVIKIA